MQGGGTGGPPPGEPVRRVEGVVVRGTRANQIPIPGQWVLLHRVGPDHAGPLDSVRTTPSGAYAMRYRATGDTSALYFASTSYGGVAYFTPPLRSLNASGDDARLTVFDTTSGPVRIAVGGRHIIVAAATPGGTRPVGEVYDLENDSTVTLVARDSTTPLWSTHIPADARGARTNAGGTIAAGAMTFHDGIAGLYAPLSPGFRQVAFSYDLPTKSFPLSIPLDVRPVCSRSWSKTRAPAWRRRASARSPRLTRTDGRSAALSPRISTRAPSCESTYRASAVRRRNA